MSGFLIKLSRARTKVVRALLKIAFQLKLINYQNYMGKLKRIELWENISKAKKVIVEIDLLGNPFYLEPDRCSISDVTGQSGLVKMSDCDSYGLNFLEEEEPVILDIGSHIGIYPRVIKTKIPKATIYSLEPDRENYFYLKLNNEMLTDVYSYQLAVYDEDTKITLRTSDENSWRSSLAANENFFRHEIVGNDSFKNNEYQVECVKIDTFVLSEKLEQISMIGITVPGEIGLQILKGANQVLKTYKPLVSISIYPSEKEAINTYMEMNGYKHLSSTYGSMEVYVPEEYDG